MLVVLPFVLVALRSCYGRPVGENAAAPIAPQLNVTSTFRHSPGQSAIGNHNSTGIWKQCTRVDWIFEERSKQ